MIRAIHVENLAIGILYFNLGQDSALRIALEDKIALEIEIILIKCKTNVYSSNR